jgi:hypothetical protein
MLNHKGCRWLLLAAVMTSLLASGCAQVHDHWIFVSLGTPPEIAKGTATVATNVPVDCTVQLPDGTSSHVKVNLGGMHPISDADLQELGRVWKLYQAEHAPPTK